MPANNQSRSVTMPVWRALQASRAPMSVGELQAVTGAQRRSINHRLRRWEIAGIVSVISENPRMYSMSSGGAVPVRIGADRALGRKPTRAQRMWTAMRVLKRFDIPTLTMTAEAARSTVESYVNYLMRAGFVRIMSRGNPKQGTWSTYQLLRRSGPRAPIIRHDRGSSKRTLVDPNDGSRVDISPGVVSLRSCIKRAPIDGGVS